jgi:hypothetical protein
VAVAFQRSDKMAALSERYGENGGISLGNVRARARIPRLHCPHSTRARARSKTLASKKRC